MSIKLSLISGVRADLCEAGKSLTTRNLDVERVSRELARGLIRPKPSRARASTGPWSLFDRAGYGGWALLVYSAVQPRCLCLFVFVYPLPASLLKIACFFSRQRRHTTGGGNILYSLRHAGERVPCRAPLRHLMVICSSF